MQHTVVEAHPEIPANKLIIMSKHTAMTYDLTMRQLFKNELQLEDMAGGYVEEANELKDVHLGKGQRQCLQNVVFHCLLVS